MTINIQAPDTVPIALTAGWLGEEYRVSGAHFVEIWIDDPTLAFTIRFKSDKVGAVWVEKVVTAGAGRSYWWNQDPKTKTFIDLKAASGTPTASILLQ